MRSVIKNENKVPKKTWKRWSEESRAMFNDMYSSMSDQGFICHPKAKRMPEEQWNTIRWNAAFLAASSTWMDK